MDHARSSDPAVQAQLDRLSALGPGADILGLDRITRLLARLGDPHRALPPLFHVAGTNGKGSTCAFLRAAFEADGKRVHVYTSPHLVRFNERIRIAGSLIDDAALAPLLEEVLDRGGDIGASFFEVTTAAAFLAFARTPAAACIVEVGLGGRLDATNVVSDPAVCGIAQLGVDHEAFLGSDIVGIAREKAGIAKPSRPLVTMAYPAALRAAIAQVAGEAAVVAAPDAWDIDTQGNAARYRDAQGALGVPLPSLPGAHQLGNYGLAIAMLRHQDRLPVSDAAIVAAATAVRWPARMQRLSAGPLTRLLPPGSFVWLDGGHNPAAGAAIAEGLAGDRRRPLHLILGMLANKDPAGLLAPIAPHVASLTAVPIPGHAHHAPQRLAAIARQLEIATARTAGDVEQALKTIGAEETDGDVLILGSLYLAGTVLAGNDELPD
ncbi:bifunctional folylpolyglutamate synthase/dihydrofolate synthase [Sphingomonas japonica]|uniref:Dihydrofolate synthase/folylpolyglutamate synthase n=1 Tax=Sphingomonas japonica TaxID=511662 RepID=A0ABX0U6V7_9SPHN|nr:bifunctional folylpolyglutamate synthase/dihydrofolate synthase [Sphingomonas japonica]NIJ24972.1 dihydrofolate synthase/folylpolyglutamate synthase [Sphingomonas japonica]